MNEERDHLLQEAQRARRWADWLADPNDRERLQAAARDYEQMAEAAEHDRVHLGYRY